MSRLFTALCLALLWPALAMAQTLPGGAAPPVHPGTKLNFPPTLGGGQLVRSYTYPIGRDVAYSYQYIADKMPITVVLFDGGRRVQAGSDGPSVVAQFTSEVDAAERTTRQEGFTNFEKQPVPSTCTYGGLAFRCSIYSALVQRDRVFSKLLLTGFRDHFVKIRIDWSQGSSQVSADADRALKAFIPALMR